MKPRAIAKTFLLLTALGSALSLCAEIPAPLKAAMDNEEAQAGRWAYTETQIKRDKHGAQKSVIIVRHDPSKPYAEQYTPLSIDGASPSKKALKKYREQGEYEAEARQKQQEQNDETKKSPPRIDLGSDHGFVDLEQASIASETDHSITFKIPIRAEGRSSFPFDKIQILIRVNKQLHAFENISLKISAPFRVKLIAKVKGAEITADYTTVEASFPPQATAIAVHANLSLMFVRIDDREEITRTDFKHVRPYDERFSVNAGPLKTLGF